MSGVKPSIGANDLQVVDFEEAPYFLRIVSRHRETEVDRRFPENDHPSSRSAMTG